MSATSRPKRSQLALATQVEALGTVESHYSFQVWTVLRGDGAADNLARTSICDEYASLTKITTLLRHISHSGFRAAQPRRSVAALLASVPCPAGGCRCLPQVVRKEYQI